MVLKQMHSKNVAWLKNEADADRCLSFSKTNDHHFLSHTTDGICFYNSAQTQKP